VATLKDIGPAGASAHLEGLFPGFTEQTVMLRDGSTFRTVRCGVGPPVLLLHGYPQTLAAWHRVAPALVQNGFQVIAADLPGYGAGSLSPHSTSLGSPSRRVFAAALCELMETLGHPRFAVAGHDRGARAGYRMALDFPERVLGFASLAVIPTLDAWEAVDGRFALRAPHWFFFAQPAELLERLLSADPAAYLDHVLTGMAGGLEKLDERALLDYRLAFARRQVRAAIFADYRAALTVDLEDERADRASGRRIACPVAYLWGAESAGRDPLEVWRRWAKEVSGAGIEGGHLQPECAPQRVIEVLVPLLKRSFANHDAA
jgi:haloacetate dehalogenase